MQSQEVTRPIVSDVVWQSINYKHETSRVISVNQDYYNYIVTVLPEALPINRLQWANASRPSTVRAVVVVVHPIGL